MSETDLPPEVRPLWIEAAFTAEYERDTLPLLFASERIFSEYYDALGQKNRSLSSAIEQIRQENAAARSYRVEGMWRESIEALMRCVELRRAVFDSQDFQYVASLRHCILSMLNFASYFMKEAGSDSESSMLSRAFELLKRAEEASARFTDNVDKLFFRALVENNFALYFMKRKLLKAAAQRLQLGAKAWLSVVPQKEGNNNNNNKQQQNQDRKGGNSNDSSSNTVGFYFAVQRGVGECSCSRFESGLELFKRAVAIAPQLPEEQDQQRADADERDKKEKEIQGGDKKAIENNNNNNQSPKRKASSASARTSSAGSKRPASAASSSSASPKKNKSKAKKSRADSSSGSDDDDEDDDDDLELSKSRNNNKNNKQKSQGGAAENQAHSSSSELPVQVSLQLLGIPVGVDAIAQIALHHNVAVAFIGMRKYKDALPWATKATELLTACQESLPANSSIVKIVTRCSEFCHKMGQTRGNISYRMSRSDFHQNDHLKKFKSLHSAIKPNAGAAAFEQRRRALQNSYNEKHGDGNNNNNNDDENNNNQEKGSRSRSMITSKNSRPSSTTRSKGLNDSSSNKAATAASQNKQSAEALRQYLKSLSYEQLVEEFGPDGKRKAAAEGEKAKPKKVKETSSRLLEPPKHRKFQKAEEEAAATKTESE
jgi:hypothetical protein